jgi:hypothetical protein
LLLLCDELLLASDASSADSGAAHARGNFFVESLSHCMQLVPANHDAKIR